MIPLGVLASGYVAPAGPTPSFAFIGSAEDTTARQGHSFAIGLGDAAPDRHIIVALTHQFTPSLIKLNGYDMTQDGQATGDGATRVTFARLHISNGTTGTLTFSTAPYNVRVGAAWWRMSGGTPSVQAFIAGKVPDFTVQEGDMIIAARYATAVSSWDGVTEDYDAAFSDWHSGGHTLATSGGTISPRATTANNFAIGAINYRF